MKNTLLIALVGVATGVSGFVAGRMTNSSPEAAEANIDPRYSSPMAAYLPPGDSRKSSAGKSGKGASTSGAMALTSHEMSYALSKALAEPNPVTRMAAITQLLSNLDDGNLDSALEVFKDIPIRPDNKHEYQMLLYAWARFDGESAIKYASENLSARGISGGELRRAALPGWASTDPAAAAAWLDEKTLADATKDGKELKDGDPVRPANDYAAALIKGWAENDPFGAAEYLKERYEHGRDRENLVGHIASSLMKESSAAAVSWAESFDDPEFKEEAFEELAEDWSSIDPDATGAWLAKHINEPYSKEAVEDLARGWAVKDLDAAVSWFETLPDGLTRGTGIYELMKIWAPQDTELSGQWLADLPQGSVSRDMGVSAYASEISKDNPEAAAQWLGTIGDADTKQGATQKVLGNWMKQDGAAALAWAEENNALPAEQLQQMQQHQAQMRSVVINGQTMQMPIDQIRNGIQNELPADAVIEQGGDGTVIIRHDGQTFQLPADVLQNDPPEVRTSIRSAN
ncbi:MAG: hypothetical protein ACI9R3_002884 [Verrucomicrobiales bacterium]|jgi:hypothetical protein